MHNRYNTAAIAKREVLVTWIGVILEVQVNQGPAIEMQQTPQH